MCARVPSASEPVAGRLDEVVDVSVVGSLFRVIGRKHRVMGEGAAVWVVDGDAAVLVEWWWSNKAQQIWN